VKAEDLEVLARKSLVTDSARLKVAISRRVREIVARLEDPSVPVRSAAQALAALAPILRLVYGWAGSEPDEMASSALLLPGPESCPFCACVAQPAEKRYPCLTVAGKACRFLRCAASSD
jgi:hypothetical protein